jgi:hypothetical protein
MPRTPTDDESIVGDECHVVSESHNGPRFDPNFPVEQIDGYDNLILLCKTHHKMIDDQSEFFSAELLRLLKQAHENRIASLLKSNKDDPDLSAPQTNGFFLERIWTGCELLEVVIGAYGYDFKHDEPSDEYEAEKIASFLQTAQDLGEYGDNLEAGDRVREGYRLTQAIKEIELMGFRLFGARYERYQSKKVTHQKAESWPVAALRLARVPKEDDGGKGAW